ncbi:hypothetical protein AXF42_Ash004289 [Apostasia shenzhenica]|uniref:Uncharacterized protein n=1 Tax=Apostasia shenzhenica TaxID=1088818 RepID=A0A2I0A2H8_9ASPA|nr:hypothetical protein AXF42_Ash004289 [Apostasia shenzhenica]
MGTSPPFSSRTTSSSIGRPNLSPLSPSPSPSRLWRPAAQRNIRNQWSKLLSSKDRWFSASSEGRSHATALVNAYLSQKYMPEMDLGVLKEMDGIRKKACFKLARKQEFYRSKLLSSYKDMVIAVTDLVKASGSMRCYLKGSGSSTMIQYSSLPENQSDPGDGGGLPVFSCLSISILEDLASELVHMFISELSLKRLLVIDLISIICMEDGGEDSLLSWSNELYDGEFDCLRSNGMLVSDFCYPIHPQIMDWPPSDPLNRTLIKSHNSDVFQVYLTTWLVDVNIDMHRVDEIFSMVQEEMRVTLR